MRIFVTFLSLVTFYASSAFAAGDFSAVFQAKARAIPARLIQLGLSNFGALELNELINQSEGVKAEFNDKVPEMNGHCRMSAHWSVVNGVRMVYVYPPWWSKFPDQQTVLALHEILGAAGFIDDQYWISTSLWLLSLPEAATALNSTNRQQISNWIVKNANARLPKGTKLAGGVVGTGGGGEGASLYVKMNALKRTLQELSSPQSQQEREISLGSIAHYLSSPLTVTYGTKCFAKGGKK